MCHARPRPFWAPSRRPAALACVLIAAAFLGTADGQQVILTGPTAPLRPLQNGWIRVQGLTADQAATARVTCTPAESADVTALQTLAGHPVLLFEAAEPGDYTVTLSLNQWAGDLAATLSKLDQQALAVADRLQPADRDAVNSVREAAAELADTLANGYPQSSASCALEVRSPNPPPVNPFPKPSEATRAILAPVLQIQTSRTDADRISKLFATTADDLRKAIQNGPPPDAAELKTTADLRALLRARVGDLQISGKYSGLDAAVNQVLTHFLSLTVRALTKQDAESLDALAWATWEAGD